jgi:GNAT superfamily N-acetyltransferase
MEGIMFQIKHYPKTKDYGKAFHELIRFLNRKNEEHRFIFFHWSRFEWMFARDNFKEEDLPNITLFYEKEKIVGALIFEDELNPYFVIYDDRLELKQTIVTYLKSNEIKDELIIPQDDEMVQLLKLEGYIQTDWIDPVTRFSLEKLEMPETLGYEIKSLEEDYRLDQIHYALWRGFDHGDDVVYSDQNLNDRRHMTSSPHFKKRYTFVAVKDNQYVAYAGIWYMENSKTALVEPVATVPEHRGKGLARACIYHAIEAVRKDGAKDIFVGSNRSVYLNMGFTPFDYAIRFKKTK